MLVGLFWNASRSLYGIIVGLSWLYMRPFLNAFGRKRSAKSVRKRDLLAFQKRPTIMATTPCLWGIFWGGGDLDEPQCFRTIPAQQAGVARRARMLLSTLSRDFLL